MRPTLKSVLLLGAGVPIALLAVLVDAALWPAGLLYLGVALAAIGIDASRVLTPARSTYRAFFTLAMTAMACR